MCIIDSMEDVKYRLVQKSSVYSISEPQEHAVQFPFLRGALRPTVPPSFSNQLLAHYFVFFASAVRIPLLEGMWYKVVVKVALLFTPNRPIQTERH